MGVDLGMTAEAEGSWSMPADTTTARVMAALDGIDRDEQDGGWWETSVGVAFGAARLAEVKAILAEDTEADSTDPT